MREIKFKSIDKNKRMTKIIQLDASKYRQFTGLKDKNGVGIYEGDIVKWYFNRYPSARKQKRVDEVKFIMGAFTPDVWRNQEVEVIGNIYENKELLKK